MTPQLLSALLTVVLEAGIFATLLLTIELAYRTTHARTRPAPAGASAAAVTGVVFSMLGLVLAFAYSDAAGRLQAHRELVVDEANAIGEVWSRLDLVQEPDRDALRSLLRQYTDQRIAAHNAVPRIEDFERHRARGEELYEAIWDQVVRTVTTADPGSYLLLVPPVLELPDVAAKRTLAVRTHVVSPALAFLALLALVSASLVGSTSEAGERRNWPYRLVFVTVVSAAVHVVIDMDYPRTGIVRTVEADSILLDVRAAMGP